MDPDRIGLSGESAGGHLAALLGTLEGAPRIRAVFALYPPTDLVVLGRQYAKPGKESSIEKLLGGPIEQMLATAREASPIAHVGPQAPPFFLIHGDRDRVVPLEQSDSFVRALTAAGVEAHLSVVPGEGHWFRLTPRQTAEVADFFRRHFAPHR